MYLLTWHGRLIATHPETDELVQLPINGSADHQALVFLDMTQTGENSPGHTIKFTAGPFEGAELSRREGRRVTLKRGIYYVAAEPSGDLPWNRARAGQWETFLLLSHTELQMLTELLTNDWILQGQPVQSGQLRVRPDFLISAPFLDFSLEAFLDHNSAMEARQASAMSPTPEWIDLPSLVFMSMSIPGSRRFAIPEAWSPSARQLISQLHNGRFSEARNLLNETSIDYLNRVTVAKIQRCMARRAKQGSERPASLIWRAKPYWEQDWIRSMLPAKGLETIESDALGGLTGGRTVVVDSRITGQRAAFYREAYESGLQIILLHLSDEKFEDDHNIYQFCRHVFRNYCSPLLSEEKNVSFFALGYKTGFATDAPPVPVRDRDYTWSFAGDPNKSTRQAMLKAMRTVGDGYEHLTSGFNTSDALEVDAYRELMRRSIFVPCPLGWVSPDSFRVYEALEAGCIPIVERRPDFDYFENALGSYPFPAVLDWNEAAERIIELRLNESIEALAQDCKDWWERYKNSLRSTIHETIFAGGSLR